MSKQTAKPAGLAVIHDRAAGIDIGSRFHARCKPTDHHLARLLNTLGQAYFVDAMLRLVVGDSPLVEAPASLNRCCS